MGRSWFPILRLLGPFFFSFPPPFVFLNTRYGGLLFGSIYPGSAYVPSFSLLLSLDKAANLRFVSENSPPPQVCSFLFLSSSMWGERESLFPLSLHLARKQIPCPRGTPRNLRFVFICSGLSFWAEKDPSVEVFSFSHFLFSREV